MKTILMAVGTMANTSLRAVTEKMVERIEHFMPFEYRELADVKATRSMTEERQKEAEGQRILASIGPGDCVMLLDEHGKMLTSREFADDVQRKMLTLQRNLVFIVGGPYGFSPAVYARANGRLALSRMTMTHEMARMFFAEQLYRAVTIIKGLPYHHD